MIDVNKACEPKCPEMHSALFKKSELGRAETIANALHGLDIYSAQQLLQKMDTYLLLTIFQSPTAIPCMEDYKGEKLK